MIKTFTLDFVFNFSIYKYILGNCNDGILCQVMCIPSSIKKELVGYSLFLETLGGNVHKKWKIKFI